MRLPHHIYGKWTEYLATCWLVCKGYRILALRYKTHVGEIDIIARKNKTIIALEVKSRRNTTQENLLSSITTHQQKRISNAMDYFIRKHPRYHHCTIRFDAIFFYKFRFPKHIQNAW